MSALLSIREVEKPWGRDQLPAPFAAASGQRIGEVWFEPPAQLPQLLIKYIFTSDKLSVQVHPSDAETQATGLGQQGKEECWLVIDAEPDAKLGIGFNAPLDADTMRAAALDGSIEGLMSWFPVSAGDYFYIPAGTVHAIGKGVSLIEVQQNSDITYRLFDYGRPRELHLDQAIAVAHGNVYLPDLHRKIPPTGWVTLADGPLFRLDQVDGRPNEDVAARYAGQGLFVVPRKGTVRIGNDTIHPGQCGVAADLAMVDFSRNGLCLIAQPCAA